MQGAEPNNLSTTSLDLSPFASGQVTTSTLNQVTASPLLGQVTASTQNHMTASTPVTNNSTAGQSSLPLNHPILASAPKDINPLNCKKGHSGREFIPSYIVLVVIFVLTPLSGTKNYLVL